MPLLISFGLAGIPSAPALFFGGAAGFAALATNLSNIPMLPPEGDGLWCVYSVITAFIFGMTIGGGFDRDGIYRFLTRKSPLHNQTLATGPDALLHITNNSDFEAPKLRVETKPRIIDAEFIDENATVDQKTYQEQVRETLAVEQPVEIEMRGK